MCGILFTWWAGRHHNGPIGERTNGGVRGEAVNTRVVKLLPVDKGQENAAADSGNRRKVDNMKAGDGGEKK